MSRVLRLAGAAVVLAGLGIGASLHWAAHARRPPRQLPTIPFAQAQSFLADFDGLPVFSGNWTGRYRPYVWRAHAFVPLLPTKLDADFARWELYSPLPIDDHELLLGGQLEGRKPFDILLLDTKGGTLRNLTETASRDEGNYCVEPASRRIAFSRDRTERFGVLGDSGLAEASTPEAPAFVRCIFEGPDSVLGATVGRNPVLYRCAWGHACAPLELDVAFARVAEFFRVGGAIGLVGTAQGSLFRRAYVIDGRSASVVADDGTEDVLDYDGAASRVGFHARYWSSLSPPPSPIVSAQLRVGRVYYAVVSDENTPRTLAELLDGHWSLHRHPSLPPFTRPRAPEEVWLSSPDGRSHQAFLFPATTPDHAVLWLHGGPQENVSPRYSAYFERLNELGFAVLALNYPGSTGQGREYEDAFTEAALVPALRAAVDYLQAHGARVIVCWSVSTGSELQRLLVREHIAISAIVDQAGFDNRDLVSALGNRLPYFSIRGAFDEVGGASGFDFVYQGGHDITRATDFDAMFGAVEPFLAGLAGGGAR